MHDSRRLRVPSVCILSVSLLAFIVWNSFEQKGKPYALIDPYSAEKTALEAQKFCSTCTSVQGLQTESNLRDCALCRLSIKKDFKDYVPSLRSQALSQVFEEDQQPSVPFDFVGINADEDDEGASITGSNDGFMDASELPAHTLKQGVLDYCMSRFPVLPPLTLRIICSLYQPTHPEHLRKDC